MRVKWGVQLDKLTPQMWFAAGVVESAFVMLFGEDFVLTSGTDGVHGENSKHYSGNAFDLRTRYLSENQITTLLGHLRSRLEPMGYDVVDETRTKSPHIHIEYDPKQGEKLYRLAD